MTKKTHINTITKGDNIQLSKKDFESIFEVMDRLDEKNLQLISENEQLKKEKEYWKSDACSKINYLSILSMDCSIVEEAIFNLKNVIDVDTEAYNLLDELSDKFNELQEHRINWGYNLLEEEKQDVIKYLRVYND